MSNAPAAVGKSIKTATAKKHSYYKNIFRGEAVSKANKNVILSLSKY